MNEELKSLAMQALANAFYKDFSALANAYMAAGKGLDQQLLAEMLADMASMYDRDREAERDSNISIEATEEEAFVYYDTLAEALNASGAVEIVLNETKVFEKREGEWVYCG